MQLSSDIRGKITYLIGNNEVLEKMQETSPLPPFDESVQEFLNAVSKELMGNVEAKAFSDVITFAFWIRKGSISALEKRLKVENEYCVGKGTVFHIAPSNVPVNFAYTLVTGLLTGNANIVRVPSKEFPQVGLIIDAFNKALDNHESLRPYIICVRYDRDKDVNDLFSSVADMRVVWGGDATIAELRKSELPPRAGEITFADRYSIAVIDSDTYLSIEDKVRVAEDFYNDTYLSDQNACTSPRIVVWTGKNIEKARGIFWEEEQKIVKKKYSLQPVLAVNKLTQSYLMAATHDGLLIEPHADNIIIRVRVMELTKELMDHRESGGFFYEYECSDVLELKLICNDKRCQTIAYIGDKRFFEPLLRSGVKGVDRIVPVGHTMDFDLIWDGYDLVKMLTRIVSVVCMFYTFITGLV